MTDAALAIDSDERKRLGQYFTGEPLARLLAALGDARSASSLLDPMAGSGDMLVAARSVGAMSAQMTAVEIDPLASTRCEERLRSAHALSDVRNANAFAPSTWAADAARSWDLVITNPPYVRYQRTSRGSAGRVAIPSASEVRHGLAEIIEAREGISADERVVFRTLVEGYSGLADLAVPSWLLCAALVAPGGRLAMVVPDTWLSRDYALPVLYLLRRLFAVEFVVEDGEAAWFEDALVRTTLVVARRVATRPTALASETASHVHARLTPKAASDTSVVGALHPRSKEPERRFAERLTAVTHSGTLHADGVDAQSADDAEFRDRLISQAGTTTWGRALEQNQLVKGSRQRSIVDVPRRLRDVLGGGGCRFSTLDQLGWNVGQGLRTGANRFFYGEIVRVHGESAEVSVDRELSAEPIVVPSGLLRVVVRKQSDLVAGGGVPSRSPGRAFVLDGHALPEDIAEGEASGVRVRYVALPEQVAEFVRRAALLNLGSPDEPRLLPTLSAVITNVRRADPNRPERAPRFWYQLPPLAARHTGALLMPRINHGHPVVVANHDHVVVDANFSTFWPQTNSQVSAPALHALLSSTWSRAAVESIGTVLGGGALKIEATQLRRVPLPSVGSRAARELDRLGATLSGSHDCREARAAIDAVVWDTLELTTAQRRAAEELCADFLVARSPRKRTA